MTTGPIEVGEGFGLGGQGLSDKKSGVEDGVAGKKAVRVERKKVVEEMGDDGGKWGSSDLVRDDPPSQL